MIRRPPRSTRTDTLFPYTTLFRSEGFWLRAERQSGGRGRLARRWESPAGNRYCSTLVQLRPHDPPRGTLALVTAVAVHEPVSLSIRADEISIKCTNDIPVGRAQLSGVLLERKGDAIVIGVGLNIAPKPKGIDRHRA